MLVPKDKSNSTENFVWLSDIEEIPTPTKWKLINQLSFDTQFDPISNDVYYASIEWVSLNHHNKLYNVLYRKLCWVRPLRVVEIIKHFEGCILSVHNMSLKISGTSYGALYSLYLKKNFFWTIECAKTFFYTTYMFCYYNNNILKGVDNRGKY